MKLSWKPFKVALAFVIIFGTVVWALTSLLPTSYNGTNLNFGVGNGTVTMTNPSDEPIPVQLVGSRSRSFTVVSATEGMAGSSTRDREDTSSVYTFTFELPAGLSEFTIARGTDVKFMADTATRLEARVNPLSADSFRTTIIVAIAIVLGSLFYASRATGHGWMRALRPQKPGEKAQPVAVPAAADVNRGRDGRMYSDG